MRIFPAKVGRTGSGTMRALVTTLVILAGAGGSGPAAAQTDGTGTTVDGGTTGDTGVTTGDATTASTMDPVLADQIAAGSEVYTQICSACHQPGGTGLPTQYPPLKGNPKVADAAYVTGVVTNGKQGPIEVLGETYNGVMPSFSTLSDDDIAAVVAYIQNGFQVPAGTAPPAPTGPVAGTELPALANLGSLVAFLLAAAVGGLVLYPRLASQNDRLHVPWLDAGLKTAAIVAAVILLVVVIPDWALKTSAVSRLSRAGQDVVGLGLWGAGLGVVLAALWYAHKESRV